VITTKVRPWTARTKSAMKWTYDPEADAAHMVLDDAAIDESEEVTPGVIFDFDNSG
jgi:uncharacterized protein YuzE